jgi:uncharacterized membrane protein YfhO
MKLFSTAPAAAPGWEKPVLYLLLSFLLPFALILIALAGLQITPFGDNTLMIADANGLYINTLSYASRMYRGLEGILYSFEKGLGGNMAGHLNAILLTPFAFLLSFFPVRDHPTVFSFISALSMSLSGLTMYLFLAGVYGHKRSHLIFSTSYALMGFSVVNVFQACFFTAAPVLPLMALGLWKLFQGKSPLLYILSIAAALFLNFYFGFILCVASVLFFAAGMVFGGEELRGKRKFLFLRYALASLCGGLLAAALWLPAFLSLQGGRLEQTSLADFSFSEKMPFLEIGAKLFSGANSSSEEINGHPNVFVGILPVALVILFFGNKEIPKRRKWAAGCLLGFYLLGFWIIAFDMLLHGGTVTNWFNFRYSYVVSFLLLFIAAELWQHLDSVPDSDMQRCLAVMVIAAVVIFSKQYEFVSGGMVLLDFALLLLIFLAWRMHQRRPEVNPRHVFEIITLLIVCINLFVNYRSSTKKLLEWTPRSLKEYRETVDQVGPLVQGVQNSSKDFFRMEVNRQRSGTCGNDPMLYGYNGVGHGGSNERDFVRKGLARLGIPWFDMRNYYADGVPAATDVLLGLRYVIAEEDLTEEKGYLNATRFREQPLFADVETPFDLYYNADALPVAMLSGSGIDSVETSYDDVFENLNGVWSALSGENTPVFLPEKEIQFVPHSFYVPEEMDAEEARQMVSYYDAQASVSSGTESISAPDGALPAEYQFASFIEYSFTAKMDGPVYVYNRGVLSLQSGCAEPVINWIGNYHAGDTVTGRIKVNSQYVDRVLMEEYCGRFRAAYADNEALSALASLVRERPVTLEKHKETHLSGTFTAESGQKLLFTIPWDEGWRFWIDGAEVRPHMVLDVFMALDVPEGSHSFEMRYTPAGLQVGLAVSCAALLMTLVFLLLDGRSRKKQMEAEKPAEGRSPEEEGNGSEEGENDLL